MLFLFVFLKRQFENLKKVRTYLHLYGKSLLSRTEKQEICLMWKDISPRISYSWHRFYKNWCGYFDVAMVPSDLYNGLIEYVMNPRRFSLYYQNKSLLYQFIEAENRCKTIFNVYDSMLYDDCMMPVDMGTCKRLLSDVGTVVVKTSIGGGGGQGVSVFSSAEAIAHLPELLHRNCIVQEFLIEADDLSRFNVGTLNTIRVLSLNLNGVCSVLSAFLRIGAKGMVVDNLSSGGILVGINSEGMLASFAVDKYLKKYDTAPSGLAFDGLFLPSYAIVRDFVLSQHAKFPLARLIGWDIVVDKEGRAVVVEVNLDSAEIQFHQMFNGPLFGSRTCEVIEYVKSHSVQKIGDFL